ncbi:class I SAM-dependent methyltransferase [Halorhodospira halochloris]|uniref:class I SAM-dependent methyltransferase n=1 Tax=Halorhodospira halochloris TaxID=1052 RepID=UPI001EE892CD|nr:class I SAM-dependent methyltransferase [Halorhodospira halochloris]MCG5530642.1 class I SAM-dependent methyltransferase [Halorhodospira halochloris]MCG5548706.1 class I SAM-dependent methyltransferase [Halorhodospira halochloris]
MSNSGVKTDEKKQHFDDIYVAETPVPFKERILDDLEYVSDDFNRQTFDRLILPWAKEQASAGKQLNFLDLCACFGNTTMATLYGMDFQQIRENWRDEAACRQVNGSRRFPAHTTAIDISANAMAYGESAGLFDQTITADLNAPTEQQQNAVNEAMAQADIVISTAALVYLEPEAIQKLIDSFAQTEREGYMLVNFLNPFALDKADATKRVLLEQLEFVGSMASRHRKLSALEQENYPGEEWALLEIWVLKRPRR